jgi:SmpA / OmlA family
MAKFSEVFSTTWKVLLALFLISLAIGLVTLVIGVMGGTGGGSSSAGLDHPEIDYDNADNASTKVPKSLWDRMIKGNMDAHVPMEGMSKSQIEQILGKPSTSARTSDGMGGETWTYTKVEKSGECQKYQGDTCVEYGPDETKTETLYFSPRGHLTTGGDFFAFNGCDVVYKISQETCKIADNPIPKKAARSSSRREERPQGSPYNPEAEAGSWRTQTSCEREGFKWENGACHAQK